MDIRYLAGLVDGEGCIRLHPSNKGKYRKYYPKLQVTNSYRPILDQLVLEFGGSISNPKRSPISTKDSWNWVITGNKARQLLNDLLPFLIIKKDKAIYVLEGDQKLVNVLNLSGAAS